MPPAPRLALALALALILGLPAAARAQDASLQGTCESLVIVGDDLTPSCRGSLLRLDAPNFASFAFATTEGRTLSFTGAGIRDGEGKEERELPVTLVAPGLTNREGISRSPTPAAGTCRIAADGSGETRVACEASAGGKRYAGAFRTRDAMEKRR